MTGTLNPAALKQFRNQRGWSQEQLARESKISKTQISRWERGKQTEGIRQSSRDRLCKALGVAWEDLTRPPKDEDTLKWRNRVPLKRGIDGSARTFLTAVQWNLGLTEEAVVDLAPLAVLILAYQSLRARQTALDEAIAAVEAATAEAHRRLPYMRRAFHDGFDYDWIQEERTSLDEREVFMTHQDDKGNEYSPLIDFLENQLKTLGLFKNDPVEFTFSYRGATPDYAVPARVLAPGLALDPDNEVDTETLERIKDGLIDLEKVAKEKMDVEAEDYRRWLEEQSQAVTEDLVSRKPKIKLFEIKL